MKQIPFEERVIFALDVDTFTEVKEWVNKLKRYIKFYKIGLQSFLNFGFGIINYLVDQGLKVMLDLKLYDIPRTVEAAVKHITKRNISYITMFGDYEILKAAVDGKENDRTKILAVTVLTSTNDYNITELVEFKTEQAVRAGCDGIVCSGWEVPIIRKIFGEDLIVVTPAIRFGETKVDEDDQKRVVDPYTAFKNGADHIVVGRAIRNSSNPTEIVKKLRNEIKRALDLKRSN